MSSPHPVLFIVGLLFFIATWDAFIDNKVNIHLRNGIGFILFSFFWIALAFRQLSDGYYKIGRDVKISKEDFPFSFYLSVLICIGVGGIFIIVGLSQILKVQ